MFRVIHSGWMWGIHCIVLNWGSLWEIGLTILLELSPIGLMIR